MNAVKIEVTEGMLEIAADYARSGNTYMIIQKALAHPDFRNQLRDMVLAAVPPRQVADQYDEDDDRWMINGHNACRAETIANITKWEKANEGQ